MLTAQLQIIDCLQLTNRGVCVTMQPWLRCLQAQSVLPDNSLHTIVDLLNA